MNPSRAGAPEALLSETEFVSFENDAGAHLETAFAAFWASHPRPVKKKETRTEFDAAVSRGVDPQEIAVQARAYANKVHSSGGDPKFTTGSLNWLRDEGWTEKDLPDPRAAPRSFADEMIEFVRSCG
ncbi:hypothetical protein BMI86_00085 [Thioclava sp. DLFJ5-1]|nr:hypothetical protein BMI86_00085 [Thioclava sp. DLFJ5-1]